MVCSVYTRDNNLYMRFDRSIVGHIEEVSAPVGFALTDFVWVHQEIVERLLLALKNTYLSCRSDQLDFSRTCAKLAPYLHTTLQSSPYLYMFFEAYVRYITLDPPRSNEVPPGLRALWTDCGMNPDVSPIVYFKNSSEMAEWARTQVLAAIVSQRRALKRDFNTVTDLGGEYPSLTMLQRFFVMESASKNYLLCTSHTHYEPDQRLADDLSRTADKSSLTGRDIHLIELHDIEKPADLLRYEFLQLMLSGLQLRRCKYCGEYFIPDGRPDIEYCSRVKFGENKRCAEIGAIRTFKNRHADDPVYDEYQKAYKRSHSRLRTGKLSQGAFDSWAEEARRLRSDCYAGTLSLADFAIAIGNGPLKIR